MASTYDLIARAVGLSLAQAEKIKADILHQLEESGSSSLVTTLRALTMQSTILAVGSLAVFESILQQENGWTHPLKETDKILRSAGYVQLADRFIDYQNAINALKHGEGRSYDKLLSRSSPLPFKVRDRDQTIFEEGNVSEIPRLVMADHEFVRQCLSIIEEIASVLSER